MSAGCAATSRSGSHSVTPVLCITRRTRHSRPERLHAGTVAYGRQIRMKRRCAYGRHRTALAVLILPILSSIAAADVGSTGDLKQLSLEELMDVQVTSVARHPESILQAPASV